MDGRTSKLLQYRISLTETRSKCSIHYHTLILQFFYIKTLEHYLFSNELLIFVFSITFPANNISTDTTPKSCPHSFFLQGNNIFIFHTISSYNLPDKGFQCFLMHTSYSRMTPLRT